jgi:hypothetical protein
MEGLFEQEVREKKNQAYLNKARTGKRGASKGRKGMNTPFDSMSLKEKRKLNGEVVVSNMYETILAWTDFELKDEETQRNLLTRWREIYPNTKIMSDLSIGREKSFNTQSFADLVNGLKCPPKRKAISSGTSRRAKTKTPAIQEQAPVLELSSMEETVQQAPVQLITQGLHLDYNGEYSAEQLSKIFTKLQLLTDGEDNKFVVAISISERA